MAAITSNVERLPVGDHRIAEWREAGLPSPSVVTGILRTIKREHDRRDARRAARRRSPVPEDAEVTCGNRPAF